MYIINKLNCYISGCCGGRNIGYSIEGVPYYFPSQIIEMIVTGIIIGGLLVSEKKYNRETLYPVGMVLYGGTRFVLNIFREEWVTTDMIMPFGNIWSLVAIAVGTLWLVWIRKHKRIQE